MRRRFRRVAMALIAVAVVAIAGVVTYAVADIGGGGVINGWGFARRGTTKMTLNRRRLLARGAAAGAAGVVGFAGVRPASAAPSLDGLLNVRDFGAIGDGTANDAPAFQAALNDLAAGGGGVLLVPAGRYRIGSPVIVNFLNRASTAVIQGRASASQILLATGGSHNALHFQNIDSILLDDLTFVGTPGTGTDAAIGLFFNFCTQATIRRCDFYGVSSQVPDGSVVRTRESDLRVQNSSFRGCSGESSFTTSVIHIESWLGLEVTDTEFIDWGILNGTYHSKTPLRPAFAWLSIGAPTPLISATRQNQILLRGVRMDEGAWRGLACVSGPPSPAVANILISGLRVAVTGIDYGYGIDVRHAENVRIEHSWFGYTTNPLSSAINLGSVGAVVIDGCRCDPGVGRIVADGAVQALTIRDSIYAKLVSDAVDTTVVRAGVSSSLLKADGPIPANALVVASATSQNRVVVAPPSAQASAILGVAADEATASGERIRVVRLRGSPVTVLSDGRTTITPGDGIGPSATNTGRVQRVDSGELVGRATARAAVTPGAAISMVLL